MSEFDLIIVHRIYYFDAKNESLTEKLDAELSDYYEVLNK